MPAIKSLAMPFGDLRRRLDQSVVYDWAMRFPIMIYCSFLLGRDVFQFCQQVAHDPVAFQQFDAGTYVAMLARISQWMFVALLAILPLFRLRPIAKSQEILPRVAALIAACIPSMFMLLARAPPSVAFNVPALSIGLFANIAAVIALGFLGRSLSVMPEARRLVRNGPYRVVRHPLYLCEMLGTLAVFLQYRSWPAFALLLIAVALQVKRARWEEEVLARAFSDFAAYRSQTAFLIPHRPWRVAASLW